MFQADFKRKLHNGYVQLVLRIKEVEIDKENNTSTVEWELWLERASSYVYNLYGTSVASVTFNDDVILEKNVIYDLRDKNWESFGKGRKVIQHDDNGEKTFTAWARLTDVAGFGVIGWYSGTVTLTKIDRESNIKKVVATELGQAVAVEIDQKIETFKHTVWYRVNSSEWFEVGTDIAYTKEFIPPIELANRITASEYGILDICVRTYDGNNQIGKDVYSYNNKIKVPDALGPTFESLELTESNEKVALLVPELNYLQNYSIISANIKNASSVYGATITAYKITARSSVVYGKRGDIIPDTPGYYDVIGEVTDSRGRKFTRSQQVIVYEYSNPKINVFLPLRAGNRTNRNVKAQTSVTVPEIRVSGRNINEYTIQIEYTARYSDGTQQWTTALRERSSQPQFTKSLDLGNVYELEKAYDFSLLVTDRFGNTARSTLPIGTAKTLAVFTKNGFALGAIPEDDEKDFFTSSLPSLFKNTVNFKNDVYYKSQPIQTHQLTSEHGKSLKYSGNLDDLKKTGSYHAFSVKSNPTGTNNYGYVNVMTHSTDDGYCVQFYIPFNVDQMYMRRCDKNRWGEWIRIVTNGTETGWKTANLQNGWKHKAGYGLVQFSKSVDGIVYFKGVATGGNTSKEVVILTLPEEYRPKTQCYVFAMNDSFDASSLSIATDGRVVIKKNVDEKWLGFDNVSFKI